MFSQKLSGDKQSHEVDSKKTGETGPKRKGGERKGRGQPPCENKMKFFIESNEKTTKNVEILDLENR